MMKTAEIRRLFLDFFVKRDHERHASGSLLPIGDQTLLFTNAGMVPFKDAFLGTIKPKKPRATSVQKCLRAGGKHNDLENVGYTARHHTFFEMLGNFSFGDYFKREAIFFAWEFLTEVLHLPQEKLFITVFENDDEAAAIWLEEVGIAKDRFARCGEADNFWSMGDTGPCGPCSEIYFDHGPGLEGLAPGVGEPGDRYVEIWNLVFMQFNRLSDGRLENLPKPSVDTGMGLERIAAVVQGVQNNFDIDLFQSLIKASARLTGTSDLKNKSLRVIADHIRACAFLIVEGVHPGPDGRHYVLRRILRRAIRHGYQLGMKDAFLYKLFDELVNVMGEAYPELKKQAAEAQKIIKHEELQFASTLERGMKLFNTVIAELEEPLIPGDTVFLLTDTYGFPYDLIEDIAREKDLKLDVSGFERCLQEQKTRARSRHQFGQDLSLRLQSDTETEFLGFEEITSTAMIMQLIDTEGHVVQALKPGSHGHVVLDKTPFYAEGGGQIGDKGYLIQDDIHFEVLDTKKVHNAYFHYGQCLQGVLKPHMSVKAEVTSELRLNSARHHSATHLLHAALRFVLGSHIQQKGSLVEPRRLRFDFTHHEALTAEQIQASTRLVNEQILYNTPVTTRIMSLADAKKTGALALFNEKYTENVRVLEMGLQQFSIELCGGTHVRHTGEIGYFSIISEQGLSAGVRRIEAVAGTPAFDYVQEQLELVSRLSQKLNSVPSQLLERLEALQDKTRSLEKALAKAQQQQNHQQQASVESIGEISLVIQELTEAELPQLRTCVDALKAKYQPAVCIVRSLKEQRLLWVIGVSATLSQTLKANYLVQEMAQLVEGQGGGRADFAQAGGKDFGAWPKAIARVRTILREL